MIPACLRKGAESSRIQELASNFNVNKYKQIQTEIETLDVENIDKIQPAREERADVEEKARGNYCR